MEKKILSVIYYNDNINIKWKNNYKDWIKIIFKNSNHIIYKGWFYINDLKELLYSNKDNVIKDKKYKFYKQRFYISEYNKDNILLKIENNGRVWKEININIKDKENLINVIEDIKN